MKPFTTISPYFWQSDMGQQTQQLGPHAQLLSLYATTHINANLFGLFRLPIEQIQWDLGLTPQLIDKTLQQLMDLHFCHYHRETEHIWILEMAHYHGVGTLQNLQALPREKREELFNTFLVSKKINRFINN